MAPASVLATARESCPKRMVYGPCGGVHADGGCEVAERRCSFVELAPQLEGLRFDTADVAVPASAVASADALHDLRSSTGGDSPAARDFAALVRAGGVITADLTLRTADPGELARHAALLAPLTAVVAGEPPGLDASLSPAHKALVLAENGVRVVAGLTCRDRNRVAIEGELAALADIGVAGVLSVTGDHPVSTVRPDARPVFDLDSTRLAALARRAGLFVAVAEQPIAPPIAYRPHRLALKVSAGARLCFLNLCGGLDGITRFAAATRAAGATVPLMAGIPIITSARGAERLAALPGIALPPGFVERVLASDDAERVGIEQAVALAESVLAIPGVAGVHLSAIGSDDDPSGVLAAGTIARTATAIRELVPAPSAVSA